MKRVNKKLITKLSLSGVLMFAGVAFAAPTITSADSVKEPVSYMQVYSAQGKYTSAQITLTATTVAGQSTPAHRCGGKNLAVGQSATIKLYSSRPHKVICDAIDGANNRYQVKFLKGKKSGPSTDYLALAGFNSIDVNESHTIPFKSCTIVKPTSGVTVTTSNCPATTTESITAEQSGLGIYFRSSAKVNASFGPSGHIRLVNTNPSDQGVDPTADKRLSKALSRNACTGTINVYYQRVGTGINDPEQGPFTKKIRYATPTSTTPYGHCEAKLSKDRAQLKKKSTYNMRATYSGNTFLQVSNSTTVQFSTK